MRCHNYDGRWMFSAVSYQFKNAGVCNADSSEMRHKVADHFEANAALYRDFPCANLYPRG